MHENTGITVEQNAAAHRFEARVEGHVAVAAYQLSGDTITFTHTVVPEELEGHGIGSKLARTGLEYAREQHLHVVPRCPFIAAYIARHKEYADLVPAEHQNLIQRAANN